MSASSCFHGGMVPAGQALPILPRSHSGPLQRDGGGCLRCSWTGPEQGFQNTWPGWALSLTSSRYLPLPPITSHYLPPITFLPLPPTPPPTHFL